MQNVSHSALIFGGGCGIRTHVGVSPNGFQDRLVMTASITLRRYDATQLHHIYGALEMWLDEPCSSNPLRIPHPKFDKLAYQTQGVGIFAKGEICLHIDAYCLHICFLPNHFIILTQNCQGFSKRKTHSFLSVNLTTLF